MTTNELKNEVLLKITILEIYLRNTKELNDKRISDIEQAIEELKKLVTIKNEK